MCYNITIQLEIGIEGMEILLDRGSSTPLYLQIKNRLREKIESGELFPATKLPPTRALAAALGVNRVTVVNAYAELEAEGLVSSHVGRGTFVAPLVGEDREEETVPAWPSALALSSRFSANSAVRDMLRLAHKPGVISFALGGPATDSLPVSEFRRAINTVLRKQGEEALQYGVPEGYWPLRVSISRYLAGQGVQIPPEEILITSGSQQGVDLVARALLRERDCLVTESPTYPGAIDAFEARGARLAGVPIDREGMRVGMLENVILQHRPRLIYAMPTFQNPSGVCMSNERRKELLTLARRYGVLVVEDATYSELRYEGHPQPALRTLAGEVIYIGSFSKIFLPGIRVGYLAAPPELYPRLVAAKQTSDLHTSSLEQRALDLYLREGHLEAHLRKMCRLYRERREAMIESLEKYLPNEVRWMRPAGGFHLWVMLPEELSAAELYLVAIQYGVAFAPGTAFFPDRSGGSYMRLNFAAHLPETIEEGMRRLGKALKECLVRPGRKVEHLAYTPTPALV